MGGIYELDLEGRKDFYGASDLGAFFGVDPFKDLHDAYLIRYEGLVQPPTKRMVYGKYFEDPIRQIACEESGINFLPMFNKTVRHPEFPKYHLAGSPDAMPEDPNEGGLEIKLLGVEQQHRIGATAD